VAIAVHPFDTGQPHRIGALDSAARIDLLAHPGVWRATAWEIVQHFLAQQSEAARCRFSTVTRVSGRSMPSRRATLWRSAVFQRRAKATAFVALAATS